MPLTSRPPGAGRSAGRAERRNAQRHGGIFTGEGGRGGEARRRIPRCRGRPGVARSGRGSDRAWPIPSARRCNAAGGLTVPIHGSDRRPVRTVRTGHRTRAVGQWLARVWDRRGRSAGAGASCESAAAAVSPCAGGVRFLATDRGALRGTLPAGKGSGRLGRRSGPRLPRGERPFPFQMHNLARKGRLIEQRSKFKVIQCGPSATLEDEFDYQQPRPLTELPLWLYSEIRR